MKQLPEREQALIKQVIIASNVTFGSVMVIQFIQDLFRQETTLLARLT